jgi:drug/metabolite transporter (DMT)-like permease
MSAPALVLARVGGAALVFLAVHRLTTNERIRSRRDYLLLALYSVLGVSLNQLLYLAGLERTTATTAQMFIVAGPAVTLAVGMMRGVEQESSFMETNVLRGNFLADDRTRQEFMSIVNRRGERT